jgi:hypothetical protein
MRVEFSGERIKPVKLLPASSDAHHHLSAVVFQAVWGEILEGIVIL